MKLRALFLLSTAALLPAADHTLTVTPQTIAWGYYWSAAKPVLTIRSGDTVEIQTVSGNPERLEQAGLPASADTARTEDPLQRNCTESAGAGRPSADRTCRDRGRRARRCVGGADSRNPNGC